MLTRRIIQKNLKGRFWKGESRSQGMVEFAVAAPILLMLIFGIIDFSLLFSAWLLVQNMARQAVRYAVTGQYNLAHCPVGGCLTQADEDAARLASIHDEANRFRPGLLVDDGAQIDEPSYLQVTVCASLHNGGITTVLPRMGSSQYGDCLPSEHPGEPGGPVIVMVDFNHPYITPILNEIWPMVHLASYQEGIVEQFRVSRLINLPPELQLPTSTPLPPTNTFTPSSTFTITSTSTATPTLLALYLEIIVPYTDGLAYDEYSQTTFQAVAYDPNVGTNDGDGIDHLTFSFSGPGSIPERDEYQAAYCAFSGNGPCSPMDEALFASLPNSNLYNNANDYYMTVTAYATDGRSITEVRRFKILKPPTVTPTTTNTGTATNTPSSTQTPTNTRTSTMTPTWNCNQFYFSTAFGQTTSSGLPRVTISLQNSSAHNTYIQSITFDWAAYDAANPSQTLNRWRFDGTQINGTDDPSSPTSWTLSGAPSGSHMLTAGENDRFDFDFLNADASWPGIVPASSFGLTVTLGNNCVVSIGAQPTATWTVTRTPTRTFTPTNTVPTSTFTRTFTRTNTVPTPTFTRTFTRTNTRTFTNTVPTPTFTRTFTRTNTVPTPTFTNTVPTSTFTRTFTRTNTVPTPTFTSTRTRTSTRTFTNTVPTPTFTRTFTRTNTVPTRTFTSTFTRTNTSTFTNTRTFTFTSTSTFTRTNTRTYTPTNTGGHTNTFTPTRTYTPTNTFCFDC